MPTEIDDLHELKRKVAEAQRRDTLWLPVFVLRGWRYRPKLVWCQRWRKPMQEKQDFGLDRRVWRIWCGPLLMVCLIDKGQDDVWQRKRVIS